MTNRTLRLEVPSMATSDGAGVKLRRSIGQRPGVRLDPFLMLDEFGTDNPNDYIAGFPSHPHRGFETVTYMIDGHMRHEDHLGHVGDLKSGGVQWMTAAHGIIHSEMPQQTDGRMRGFQLWINLPSSEKMRSPSYRDIQPDEIPSFAGEDAAHRSFRVKLIAGKLPIGGITHSGPINGLSTEPLFLDIELEPDASFTCPIKAGLNAFTYPYEGSLYLDEGDGRSQRIAHQSAGILSDGDTIAIKAGKSGSRAIILAGRPIGEPIVQYGPFVMNTREEIEEALNDYQSGRLTVTS